MAVSFINGRLEIDHNRGVIYFHMSVEEIKKRGILPTVLRICRLPTPIPKVGDRILDITHMIGCDWP